MSELRSIVEQMRSESLPELPDARIEEDFAELHRALEGLEVERLRRLAEIERRRLFERDGHVSAASWLAGTLKVAWGTAREHVRTARALEEMPDVRKALDAGDISMSSARVLVAAREVDPTSFERDEAYLVDAARIHSMSELHRVLEFWRQRVEETRSDDPDERLRERRRLHASASFLGMVRVDGDLDPESGETLLTALRAVLDAESRTRRDDARSPAQRHADALTEICRQWLDGSDRPSVAGERPHVTLTVDAAVLEHDVDASGTGLGVTSSTAEASRAGELDHAGPVSVRTVRRLIFSAPHEGQAAMSGQV